MFQCGLQDVRLPSSLKTIKLEKLTVLGSWASDVNIPANKKQNYKKRGNLFLPDGVEQVDLSEIYNVLRLPLPDSIKVLKIQDVYRPHKQELNQYNKGAGN